MVKIDAAFLDLRYLDTLASGNSTIHRLDPRVKVLTTALFVICVVSFDKYVLSAMLPFALFLSLVMGLAGIPASYVVKKLVLVLPFVLLIGLFNPLLDRLPLLQFGPLTVSGGWLSFFSILLRSCLTVGALLTLIATTGFNAVCMALEKMGMPKIFAVQLLLLYRYIFVLAEEGQRMHRARSFRCCKARGTDMKTFASLIGCLLLRTLDRAHRIHLAMLCRGFDGTIRTRQTLRLTVPDALIFLGSGCLLLVMRSCNLSLLLGRLLMEGL